MSISRVFIIVFSCSVLFLGCDTRPAPSELNPIPVDDLGGEDGYSVAAGDTLTVETPERGVLKNDVDPDKYDYNDDDPEVENLSVVVETSGIECSTTDPDKGALELNKEDGTFTYVAPSSFSGVARFEYCIEDTEGGGVSKDAAAVEISSQ